LDALDKKDDYKSISNIGRPVSNALKPPTRAQIQSNLSDVKEHTKRERSGSNSKAKSNLNSTNKQ
jgi:hypothetical protein